MPIDWRLYEGDVNRWYSEEGKTANTVIKLLKDAHNLDVTIRQFKAKFGGSKNLHGREWKALIPEIRKRQDEGRRFRIYVLGKPLKQESVARAIRRYSGPCGDGSGPEPAIDLGIDTIGQHRIEIRTSSQPGSQLPRDDSTAKLQHTHGGEDASQIQHDDAHTAHELDVDMDVEFIDTASGPVICCSPLGLVGNLDELSRHSPGSFFLEDVNGNRMGDSGTILRPSQQALLFPSVFPTGLPSFGHDFTSFWDFPEISSSTSTGCRIVSLVAQLGIFVPDHGRNRCLPKFDLSPAQAEALEPIMQSVKELLALPDSSGPEPFRLGRKTRTLSSFPPNLLHIADDQSLGQALSVIVYMVSNNLLSGEENSRLVCWILERGHMKKLLAFSQLPAVRHLAFGSAFLRVMCKMDSWIKEPHRGLFRDLIDSREFVSLVTSHHQDLSGPLGRHLFLLAVWTDNIGLAKLLVSHGFDIEFNTPPLPTYCTLTFLEYAVNYGTDSMLEYVMSLGADGNQECHSGPALLLAIGSGNTFAVRALLRTGARIPEDSEDEVREWFKDAPDKRLEIYELLREQLELDSEPDYGYLIEAARKGYQELSKVLAHNIASSRLLEHAMCEAVKLQDLRATKTFLQSGVSPITGMAALRDCLKSPDEWYDEYFLDEVGNMSLADIFYLLIKAGAQCGEDTAQTVRDFVGQHYENAERRQLLRVLLQVGYDQTWVHQFLLVSSAEEGSIFECDHCIDMGASINGFGFQGKSALVAAAGEGHLALVQHLISQGADPNLPPDDSRQDGKSALYAAFAGAKLDVALFLIDSGSDVTIKASTAGVTLLEALFLSYGDTSSYPPSHRDNKLFNTCFRKLIDLRAPVKRPNGTSSFLLHELILYRQPDLLELALQVGARTEDKSEAVTPIQLAVLKKDSHAVQSLLNCDADIEGPADSHTADGKILSMDSPLRGVGTLLSHSNLATSVVGDDGDKEVYFPHTPLQIASSSDCPDLGIVKLLLSCEADVNAPAAAWHGRTALQGAASVEEPNIDLVKLLLNRGADVNAPPAQVGGVTALQGAAIQGNIKLARFLLEKEADINAPGAPEVGRTALEGAAEHGRIEMLRFLLSKGAMPNRATGYSKAIELAEEETHLGIVKLLREEQDKLQAMDFPGIDLNSFLLG